MQRPSPDGKLNYELPGEMFHDIKCFWTTANYFVLFFCELQPFRAVKAGLVQAASSFHHLAAQHHLHPTSHLQRRFHLHLEWHTVLLVLGQLSKKIMQTTKPVQSKAKILDLFTFKIKVVPYHQNMFQVTQLLVWKRAVCLLTVCTTTQRGVSVCRHDAIFHSSHGSNYSSAPSLRPASPSATTSSRGHWPVSVYVSLYV